MKNEGIRNNQKVLDVINRVADLKWQQIGYVVCQDPNRCTNKTIHWSPRITKRGTGRKQKRWILRHRACQSGDIWRPISRSGPAMVGEEKERDGRMQIAIFILIREDLWLTYKTASRLHKIEKILYLFSLLLSRQRFDNGSRPLKACIIFSLESFKFSTLCLVWRISLICIRKKKSRGVDSSDLASCKRDPCYQIFEQIR